MAHIEQKPVVIPDLSIQDLLSVIPSRCFKRSTLRSSSYVVWDLFMIGCIYKTAIYADSFIVPEKLSLPHPLLYTCASFAIWSLYGFAAGLFATGLWVIAHECGHQAFSESKFINNSVGWGASFGARGPILFVAHYTRQAPRFNGPHDPRPGSRPQNTIRPPPSFI